MITVRFPNGQAVQYNEANQVEYIGVPAAIIRINGPNGRWFADIPLTSGAIIEASPPCRVYNPLADTVNEKIAAELAAVKKELRAIKRKVGK